MNLERNAQQHAQCTFTCNWKERSLSNSSLNGYSPASTGLIVNVILLIGLEFFVETSAVVALIINTSEITSKTVESRIENFVEEQDSL